MIYLTTSNQSLTVGTNGYPQGLRPLFVVFWGPQLCCTVIGIFVSGDHCPKQENAYTHTRNRCQYICAKNIFSNKFFKYANLAVRKKRGGGGLSRLRDEKEHYVSITEKQQSTSTLMQHYWKIGTTSGPICISTFIKENSIIKKLLVIPEKYNSQGYSAMLKKQRFPPLPSQNQRSQETLPSLISIFIKWFFSFYDYNKEIVFQDTPFPLLNDKQEVMMMLEPMRLNSEATRVVHADIFLQEYYIFLSLLIHSLHFLISFLIFLVLQLIFLHDYYLNYFLFTILSKGEHLVISPSAVIIPCYLFFFQVNK